MIATSRKSSSRPAISRRYEFSRLEDQMLASAYEALIPAVTRRPQCVSRRRDSCEASANVRRSQERSVAGA